jgi:hypothetical protein
VQHRRTQRRDRHRRSLPGARSRAPASSTGPVITSGPPLPQRG